MEGDSSVLDNSMDMLNLCSGRFGSSAADSGGFGGTAPDSGSSGGRVTVQDISFNLDPSSDILGKGNLSISLLLHSTLFFPSMFFCGEAAKKTSIDGLKW